MGTAKLCPVCGYSNRSGALVCDDCGLLIPQYQACVHCGFMNTADSRYCGKCGLALEDRSATPSGPKTVPIDHPEGPLPLSSAPSRATDAASFSAPSRATEAASFSLVHEGTGVAIDIPLTDSVVVLGRPGGEPDIDVSGFPEATVVSRRHARLTLRGGGVSIEDLGSANGTYVNNVRISGRVDLLAGDRVGLGQGAKLVFVVRR